MLISNEPQSIECFRSTEILFDIKLANKCTFKTFTKESKHFLKEMVNIYKGRHKRLVQYIYWNSGVDTKVGGNCTSRYMAFFVSSHKYLLSIVNLRTLKMYFHFVETFLLFQHLFEPALEHFQFVDTSERIVLIFSR